MSPCEVGSTKVKVIVTLRGQQREIKVKVKMNLTLHQIKVKVIVTLRGRQLHPGDHSSLRGQLPAAASPVFTISSQLEDNCAQAEGPALTYTV